MTHLSTLIRQRVQSKPLPFVDFMQLALYEPQFGYYTGGLQKFGPSGDFITAPELSPLFGKALGHQCQQVLQHLDKGNIFEFGAGEGKLCIDILKHLKEKNALPEAYFVLELSAELKKRQQNTILEEIPELFPKVHWLSSWPKEPFQGVILANEVLDAMPVFRFKLEDNNVFESHISLGEQDHLDEVFLPCQEPRLLEFLKKALPEGLPHPYISEANLFIDGWMAECGQMLDKGAMFVIDYGFPRQEYYHPDRCQGTLMCHYQHRAHSNFLLHIGEQDITAHVDFTKVAEAAVQAEFEIGGFCNQASFLMANGILSFLEEESELQSMEHIKNVQAVKQLIQPHEMGELFKVIGLVKNVDLELQGFDLGNRLHAL